MNDEKQKHPFDDEKYFKKILQLLNSPKPESKDELLRMYEDALVYYKERGWTEYWGVDSQVKEKEKNSEAGRVKNLPVKPVAPMRKDFTSIQQRAASPSESNVISDLAETNATNCPSKQSTSYSVTEVNLFADEDSQSGSESKKRRKRPPPSLSDKSDADISDQISSKSVLDSIQQQTSTVTARSNFANVGVCNVCKDLSVSIGNTLVTCDECSNLYHQKCHEPEIDSSELRDPRFIFVCAICKAGKTSTNSTGANSNCKETNVITEKSPKITAKPTTKLSPGSQMFKATVLTKDRADSPVSPTKTNSNSSLASMAADFLAKQRPAKVSVVSKSATSDSSIVKPSTSMTTATKVALNSLARSSFTPVAKPLTTNPRKDAEKRLQAMLKKAAQSKSLFK